MTLALLLITLSTATADIAPPMAPPADAVSHDLPPPSGPPRRVPWLPLTLAGLAGLTLTGTWYRQR